MGRFWYLRIPDGEGTDDLKGGILVGNRKVFAKRWVLCGACPTFFLTSPKFFGPRSIEGGGLLNCSARKTDKFVGTRLLGN